MGYHSGLNGEYNIPVEVNSKHIAHFRRCCKEEVPEKAIKVETYLKDDTIYFVLPNNYKPVKIAFEDSNIYGGKGNQKLNVDFRSTGQGLRPRTPGADSTGYYQDDNCCVNISDSTNYAIKTPLSPSAFETDTTDYAQANNTYESSNGYISIFDSLLDLNNQINAMGYSAEEAGDALSKLFDKLYDK